MALSSLRIFSFWNLIQDLSQKHVTSRTEEERAGKKGVKSSQDAIKQTNTMMMA